MLKPKESRRLGIMKDSETHFLYLSESEKKKHYSPDYQRQLYKRITDGANKAFQDINSMIARLPHIQLEKIEFELGLNSIHKSLAKKGLIEREPHRAVEEALYSLDSCLEIIRKYNKNLEKIAEPDFNLVRDWLNVVQKFPKSQGEGL